MASSAKALEIIRDHVSRYGEKLQLGQVIPNGGDGVAGIGLDRDFGVSVDTDRTGRPLDARVFPSGVLSGRLACRAVLLEPEAAGHPRFMGNQVDDAMYLRTRLQYMEPRPDSLPYGVKALTIGGPVTHVAVHNFMPGDGEQLDDYYARVAEYEAALAHGEPAPETPPAMPVLNTYYELVDLAGVPNVKGENANQMAAARLSHRRLGFEALQERVPAARVLSLGNQGFISEDELSDWAETFVSAPQQ